MTEGNEAHVHHLIIYLCSSVNETHVGNGGECDSSVGSDIVEVCRNGLIIAAWAVGGEVSSLFTFTTSTIAATTTCYTSMTLFIFALQIFVYPDNVAFPFGGGETPDYVLMELHYDNPQMVEGV